MTTQGTTTLYEKLGGEAAVDAAVDKLYDKVLVDEHFDAVKEDRGVTLEELGVPAELIGEAVAIAETTRDDVLGRSG